MSKIINIIENKLKNHKSLYLILQIIHHHNDSKYLSKLTSLETDSSLVSVRFNNNKMDKMPCIIKASSEYDGLCASLRWALDGIFFSEKLGAVPYIYFGDDSIYKDHNMKSDIDPFEYYFKQPTDLTLTMIQDTTYIDFDKRNREIAESINGGISYNISEKYIIEMSYIWKKYLDFNDSTKRELDNYLNSINITNNTLGIHIRGTDYKKKYVNHPVYVGPEDYCQYIDEAMRIYGFEKLYIATDDKQILEYFCKKYDSDKIIYAKEFIRGDNDIGVHVSNNSKYEVGLEVLKDMYCLAHCDGFISGMSQVSLITRIYKRSSNERFLYDKIISKGINTSGEMFSI